MFRVKFGEGPVMWEQLKGPGGWSMPECHVLSGTGVVSLSDIGSWRVIAPFRRTMEFTLIP